MTSPRGGGRRCALALAFFVFGGLGCAWGPEPRREESPPSSLHVAPLTDLAPAASLVWLVDVRPRALTLAARLSGPVGRVLPDERLRAFARMSGGVDLREADEVAIASYPETTLLLARAFVEPPRVEAAFRARAVTVEGRAVDGPPGDPRSAVTRLWGTTGAEREQIAIFGYEAVGMERGRFGPLRAAELFAEGKLKRASPALRAPPLARVAELLGDAEVRAFAAGPFEGGMRQASGGLLAASTAVGASARGVVGPSGDAVAVHAVLLGAWGTEAGAAADRLRAVFDLAAGSGIGRLFGLAHCVAGPAVAATDDALTLDFTLDANVLAEGVRAATDAEVSEIMAP